MSGIAKFNIALVSLLILCGIFVFFSIEPKPVNISRTSVSASLLCSNPIDNISIDGTAGYAEDLKTGRVLYSKNADAQLPLASLTKLMTALVASDTLKDDDVVTISKDALLPEGDAGLVEGERWHVRDLIDFTLVTSANDGAEALALAAAEKMKGEKDLFVLRMNEKAQALRMTQTFFVNDTGLDVSKHTGGAYGSARDVAKLFTYITRTNPSLIEGTTLGEGVFVSLDGRRHIAKNTSTVITELAGGIGSKTGFTDLAGGNLGVVFEPFPGRAVTAVVLGSTREGRDTDMQNLARASKTTLKRVIVCSTK